MDAIHTEMFKSFNRMDHTLQIKTLDQYRAYITNRFLYYYVSIHGQSVHYVYSDIGIFQSAFYRLYLVHKHRSLRALS